MTDLDLPTVLDGAPVSAEAWYNKVAAAVQEHEDSLSAVWTDYSSTFTLTGAVTDPTKGNSTYTAHYLRQAGSDLVHVRIYILIGTTFAVGSGAYRFLLPPGFAASANSINGMVGVAYSLDSGTAHRTGVVRLADATHAEVYSAGAANAWNNNTPQVWANPDTIALDFLFEPA